MVSVPLRLLFLAIVGCSMTLHERIEEIHKYIGNAFEHLGSVDPDIEERIPRMIIIGDQGVGKSTTLNRLSNETIFPPRTKEQADHDQPQTMIATVYRTQKGSHFTGNISCSLRSCRECAEKQVATPEAVQTSIKELQTVCFGSEFDADATISVSIQGPNAANRVLVDLPGIQQGSSEGYEKTQRLTEKWLATHKHSIILAVIPAERNLQSEVVRILEANSQYARRTVLIVTKPESIPRTSAKVLNLFANARVEALCAGRIVVLKSADVSDPKESAWNLNKQMEEETTWFKQHPQYNKSSEHCGIQALSGIADKALIQEACAVLPSLMKDFLRKQKDVGEKLANLPEDFNEDPINSFIDKIKINADEMIRSKGRKLNEIYKEMKSMLVNESIALYQSPGGLPEYGMQRLHARNPFFQKWNEGYLKWIGTLTNAMGQIFERAGRLAMVEVRRSARFPFQDFRALASCKEVDKAIHRAIISQRFELDDPASLDQKAKLEDFVKSLNHKIRDTVVRLAIQMCVDEPVEELGMRIRTINNGSLIRKLQRAFDFSEDISERSRLQREWNFYSMQIQIQPCDGVEQVSDDGDVPEVPDEYDWDVLEVPGEYDSGSNVTTEDEDTRQDFQQPTGAGPFQYVQAAVGTWLPTVSSVLPWVPWSFLPFGLGAWGCKYSGMISFIAEYCLPTQASAARRDQTRA